MSHKWLHTPDYKVPNDNSGGEGGGGMGENWKRLLY